MQTLLLGRQPAQNRSRTADGCHRDVVGLDQGAIKVEQNGAHAMFLRQLLPELRTIARRLDRPEWFGVEQFAVSIAEQDACGRDGRRGQQDTQNTAELEAGQHADDHYRRGAGGHGCPRRGTR